MCLPIFIWNAESLIIVQGALSWILMVMNSSGPKVRQADTLKKRSMEVRISNQTLEAVERDYIIQTLEQSW